MQDAASSLPSGRALNEQEAPRSSLSESDLSALPLRPCPFCGGPAILFASSDHSTAWEGGCCAETGCPATPQVWELTEQAAIAAWNRRPSAAPSAESSDFAERVEAVIACLGDDAAQIRQEAALGHNEPTAITIVCDEWADNMDAAANLLQLLPELLEALQDLLDTGYTGGPQGKRARAALAKATGTQPEAQGWRARDASGSPARQGAEPDGQGEAS